MVPRSRSAEEPRRRLDAVANVGLWSRVGVSGPITAPLRLRGLDARLQLLGHKGGSARSMTWDHNQPLARQASYLLLKSVLIQRDGSRWSHDGGSRWFCSYTHTHQLCAFILYFLNRDSEVGDVGWEQLYPPLYTIAIQLWSG